MRVLFLDLDGVANRLMWSLTGRKIHLHWPFSDQSKVDLSVDEAIAKRFGEFFKEASEEFPDLKIVLSSTWRDLVSDGNKEQENYLFSFLSKAFGIDRAAFIGCTERGPAYLRDEQIEAYVTANNLNFHDIVVIDDSETWFLTKKNVQARLVLTSGNEGFWKLHGNRMLMLLRGVTTAETPEESTSFHIVSLIKHFESGLITKEKCLAALSQFESRKAKHIARRLSCDDITDSIELNKKGDQ